MTEQLPWLQHEWQRLLAQVNENRLPHALLICGPQQSGKTTLAGNLAAALLCRADGAACGECSQCHLVAAGTHPDLLLVTLLEEKGKEATQVKVDQIREMIEWASQTAQQGGRKVCLVDPADALNVQASNALLKCLEEPPSGTFICLVTSTPTRLLPTLRSRCRRINCVLPQRAEALDWMRTHSQVALEPELLLEITGGVPLRAIARIDADYLALRTLLASHLMPLVEGRGSPLKLAAEMSKSDPGLVFEILYQLVADSVVVSQSDASCMRNKDVAEIIVRYASAVSLKDRFALLDRIMQAQKLLASTSNANPQMLLEWVLLRAA